MNKLLGIIIILISVLSVSGQNLLTDGDFEDSGMVGWTTNGFSSTPVTYDFDYTTAPYEGSECLRQAISSSVAWNGRYVFQQLAVTAGSSFQARGWLKINTAFANAQVYLEVQFNDGGSSKIQSTVYNNTTIPWTQVTCSTTIPSGATIAEVRLVILPEAGGISGEVFWDDIFSGPSYIIPAIKSLTNTETIILSSSNNFIITTDVSNSTNFYIKLYNDSVEVTNIKLVESPADTGHYVSSNWSGLGYNNQFYGDGNYDIQWCFYETNDHNEIVLTNTSIYIDTAPPYVKFSLPLPDNNSTIYSKILPVRGESDADQINLYINGSFNKQIPLQNSSFNEELKLNPGETTIRVEFIDQLGNSIYKLFKVTYSKTIPADNRDEIIIYCENEATTYLTIPRRAVLEPLQLKFTRINNDKWDSIDNLKNDYGLDRKDLLKLYEIEMTENNDPVSAVQFNGNVEFNFSCNADEQDSPALFYYNNLKWVRSDRGFSSGTKRFTPDYDHLYPYYSIFKNVSSSASKVIEASPNPFTPLHSEHNVVHFITDLKDGVSIKSISIFNVRGIKVRDLVPPNLYWDGKDNQGEVCSGGMYIYTVETTDGDYHGSIVLIK